MSGDLYLLPIAVQLMIQPHIIFVQLLLFTAKYSTIHKDPRSESCY